MSIIDGAAAEAQKHGGARVSAVYLKLGPLSGVVKDALLFSYDLAAADTLLEGSTLVIEEIPIVVFCPDCNLEKTIAVFEGFCCPDCGALTPDVLTGRELELTAIELADELPADSSGTGQLAEVNA